MINNKKKDPSQPKSFFCLSASIFFENTLKLIDMFSTPYLTE